MLDAMLTGLCEAAPLGERKMFEFRRVASDMWLKNGDNVSRCITGTGAISGGVKTSKLKVRGGRGAVVQARWTTSLDLLQACFCTLISLPVTSCACGASGLVIVCTGAQGEVTATLTSTAKSAGCPTTNCDCRAKLYLTNRGDAVSASTILDCIGCPPYCIGCQPLVSEEAMPHRPPA